MRRRLLGVWFCFAFVLLAVSCCAEPLPIAAPESVGLSPERLSKLGKFLTDEIDNNNLPGAVVAVARRGRLAYFEALGFQDKPAGKAMRKDAIFRVYSMTKPWTSVAAMMLVEEGRIQLTDPVSKYLPSFRNLRTATREAITAQSFDIAADREPTIQNLLTHTSGIAYDFLTKNSAVKEAYQAAGFQALGRDIRDKMTAAEFTERLSKLPLANQPGATWEYGLSTAVLGRVIEAVSGVPLSRFLEERLFLPLGMTDSGFVVAKDKADRIAQPLLPYETIEIFDPVIPAANDLGGEGGLSTAGDYLRFAQMLLAGGRLEGTRILSRTTVAQMTTDFLTPNCLWINPSPMGPGEIVLGTPGYTFGFGFAVRTSQGNVAVPGSPGEFMWGGAAGTYFWVDPKEELAAVFMAQAPFSRRLFYRRAVKQLIYASIVD